MLLVNSLIEEKISILTFFFSSMTWTNKLIADLIPRARSIMVISWRWSRATTALCKFHKLLLICKFLSINELLLKKSRHFVDRCATLDEGLVMTRMQSARVYYDAVQWIENWLRFNALQPQHTCANDTKQILCKINGEHKQLNVNSWIKLW